MDTIRCNVEKKLFKLQGGAGGFDSVLLDSNLTNLAPWHFSLRWV